MDLREGSEQSDFSSAYQIIKEFRQTNCRFLALLQSKATRINYFAKEIELESLSNEEVYFIFQKLSKIKKFSEPFFLQYRNSFVNKAQIVVVFEKPKLALEEFMLPLFPFGIQDFELVSIFLS